MNYTHNEYLQLLSDYGLIIGGTCLLAFAVWVCSILWRFHSVSKEQRVLYAGSLSVIFVFMVQSLVSFPLHILPNVMLFMVCIGAVIRVTSSCNHIAKKVAVIPTMIFITIAAYLTVVSLIRTPLMVARDKAAKSGESLVKSQKKFAESGRNFADYRDLGDMYFSRAFHDATDFTEYMEKAKDAYKKAKDLHPYDLKSQVALGVSLDYLEDFESAERELRDAAQRGVMRESFLQTHRRLSQHYAAWGISYYERREPEKALYLFQQALFYLEETDRLWSKYDPTHSEEQLKITEYINFLEKAGIKANPVEGVLFYGQ